MTTPLARLFALAYRELIDGLHAELPRRGWTDVRPSYGFVLLAVAEQPASVTELATLLATSKQATSKLVDAIESAGYVQRSIVDSDGRQRAVHLTARGRDLLDEVAAIYADLEQAWADRIGRDRIEQIRSGLTDLVVDTTGDLPAVRPPN